MTIVFWWVNNYKLHDNFDKVESRLPFLRFLLKKSFMSLA